MYYRNTDIEIVNIQIPINKRESHKKENATNNVLLINSVRKENNGWN